MELILKTQSNFGAGTNVTVAPIGRENQSSVMFKVSIKYFICVWEICKMKGFPFSWDNNLTSCDHPNSCSVLQYFTSEEALRIFCSLCQIKTPVLYSGLLFLRLNYLIPMLQLQKRKLAQNSRWELTLIEKIFCCESG